MNCDRFEDLIQEYLDKSLDRSQTKELEAHLKKCPDCRKTQLLYQAVASTLDELGEVEAPSAEIRRGVARAIDSLPAKRRSGVTGLDFTAYGLRWAVGLAAVALMALGLVFVARPVNDHSVARPAVIAKAAPVTGAAVAVSPVLAKVMTSKEGVSVLRKDSTEWVRVSGSVALRMGDRVRTGATDERVLLIYSDQGFLSLRPDTDVQVIAGGVRIRRGYSWIRITKKGSHFFAQTPNAVAAVRGTIFGVGVDDSVALDLTTVDVYEGRVQVKAGAPQDENVPVTYLVANQRINVEEDSLGDIEAIPYNEYIDNGMSVPEELANRKDASTADDVVPDDTDGDSGDGDNTTTEGTSTTGEGDETGGDVQLLGRDTSATSTAYKRPGY